MISKIKLQGNDGVVLIPNSVLKQAHLETSRSISIEVVEDRIVIEALEQQTVAHRLPFSEDDLLRDLDAYTAHSDELL